MANYVKFVLGLIAIIICVNGAHSHKGVIAQTILNDILGPSYDKNIRAFGNGSDPTIVYVNFYTRSIKNVNDIKMEMDTQLTFRMEWLDTRLRFEGKKDAKKLNYISLTDPSKVWLPDVFFTNELEGHQHKLLVSNSYLRIFSDGHVLFSTRLSLKLDCPMILVHYPFDSQTCSIRLASYGYTSDDIILKWKRIDDPVQITPSLNLPLFGLTQINTDYCDSMTNTGTYSCLRADFHFKREFRRYLIDIYIPCTMLVIIAWLSLWLEHHGPGSNGRLLMSIGTLLVMSLFIQTFNGITSSVSYTKKIDVWTGMCLTFVFSTIVEFILVNYLARNQILTSNESRIKSHNGFINAIRDWRNNCSDVIDIITRIIYPIAFFFFVIAYYATIMPAI